MDLRMYHEPATRYVYQLRYYLASSKSDTVLSREFGLYMALLFCCVLYSENSERGLPVALREGSVRHTVAISYGVLVKHNQPSARTAGIELFPRISLLSSCTVPHYRYTAALLNQTDTRNTFVSLLNSATIINSDDRFFKGPFLSVTME